MIYSLICSDILQVENGQSSIIITQYHFTSWPDHGVPEYGTPLMILHKKMMAGWRRGDPPILVHCSAGVGRTGTFITIDLALEQAKKEGVVDIAGIVNRLRQQRTQMVQTVVCIQHDSIYTSNCIVCLSNIATVYIPT